MGWFELPTRRELTLLLFAVTIFTLSYNLDNSIRQYGLDPISKQGAVFNKFGIGGPSIIGKDGRRPPEWRDSFEKFVFGDWDWDEGHTGGAERTRSLDGDEFGALWHDREKVDDVGTDEDGFMHDVLDWWGSKIPTTRLIKHVPGFTILDSAFLYDNSIVIVTDAPEQFPAIGTASIPVNIISPSKAQETLGRYGGKLHGVTWLSTESNPHNATLFSMWRFYSSLDPSIDSVGRTILPPPRRLILPRIPIYSDHELPFDPDNITKEVLFKMPRMRSDTGFHPYLAKIAFPTMGMLYQADWEDYHKMGTPYKLDRIVIASMEVAANSTHPGQPTFAPPFELDSSPHWWQPIRRTVENFFESAPVPTGRWKADKVGITYVHRQWDKSGPRLTSEDHTALVKGLNQLQRDLGHDVFVVSSLDEETPWYNRVKAISRSKIILGVHGNHLLDSVFLQPSEKTTLIEFYPTDKFSRERQLVAVSLGMQYSAWWHNREFSGDDLPVVDLPGSQEVSIDANAVVRSIREILARR